MSDSPQYTGEIVPGLCGAGVQGAGGIVAGTIVSVTRERVTMLWSTCDDDRCEVWTTSFPRTEDCIVRTAIRRYQRAFGE